MAESLNSHLIVVRFGDAEEEIDPSALNELALTHMIGSAVLKMLKQAGDGEPVEVAAYAQ
jgi:hypothetical protein